MSDLVGNPEDRFSRVAALIICINYRTCFFDLYIEYKFDLRPELNLKYFLYLLGRL